MLCVKTLVIVAVLAVVLAGAAVQVLRTIFHVELVLDSEEAVKDDVSETFR